MQQIVDFLRDYWQYISVALVIVLDVFILIIKRTKVYTSGYNQLLRSLILEAEETDLSGRDKLEYVLKNFYNRYPQWNFIPVYQLIYDIEDLLSLPTKKGGCGREKIIRKS